MVLPTVRRTISVVIGVLVFFATFAPFVFQRIHLSVNIANTKRYPEQLIRIRMKQF